MHHLRRVGAALTAGVLGIACHGQAPASRPAAVTHLKMIYSPHLSWGPVILAQELGYFADQGLEIEFVRIGRGSDAMVALLGGDVDILAGPIQAGYFTALGKGATLRMVAGLNYLQRGGCTYFGLVLRPGLTPENAPGKVKRVMTGTDGFTRFLTERMLAARGVELDKLQTLRLPTAATPTALADGSIDVAELTEPQLTRITKPGNLWLSAQDVVPDFQWSVVSFGERLLHKDPDAGTRFLVAVRRGIEEFSKGKTPANVERLAKVTREEPEVIEKSCWPAFPADGRPNLESVKAYEEWAVAKGWIDRAIPMDSLWEPRFLLASDTALLRRRP